MTTPASSKQTSKQAVIDGLLSMADRQFSHEPWFSAEDADLVREAARLIQGGAVETTPERMVSAKVYEAAVEGRRDFRAAYRTCRDLLQKFADAWEGKSGHENMDRLCELVRTNPMHVEETMAEQHFLQCSKCQQLQGAPIVDHRIALTPFDGWSFCTGRGWWCPACTESSEKANDNYPLDRTECAALGKDHK